MSQDKKGKAKVVEERHSEDESDQTSANEEGDHDQNFNKTVGPDGIPKAARSAFAFYQHDAKAKITKENKSLPPAEVQALIKTNWAALKSKDKEVYEKLHASDTIRYMKAMAQLKKDRPELFETKKEAVKHSPKKPPAVSPYTLFTKEWNKKKMEEGEKLAFNEASKLCGKAWSDLTEAEKEPYVKAAAAENERRHKMTPEEIAKEKKAAASKKRKAEDAAEDEPAAKRAKTSEKKDDKKADKKTDKEKQKEKDKQKEKEKEKAKEKKRKEEQKKKEQQKKQQSSSSEEESSD